MRRMEEGPGMIAMAAAVTALFSAIAGLVQWARARREFPAASGRWSAIVSAVAVVMLFFAVAVGAQFVLIGYPMSIIVTPVLTIVLMIHSPVPWGSAAAAVTVLHLVAWIGGMIGDIRYAPRDTDLMASMYIVNVVAVAGMAKFWLATDRRP
jgi:hypothetical protein